MLLELPWKRVTSNNFRSKQASLQSASRVTPPRQAPALASATTRPSWVPRPLRGLSPAVPPPVPQHPLSPKPKVRKAKATLAVSLRKQWGFPEPAWWPCWNQALLHWPGGLRGLGPWESHFILRSPDSSPRHGAGVPQRLDSPPWAGPALALHIMAVFPSAHLPWSPRFGPTSVGLRLQGPRSHPPRHSLHQQFQQSGGQLPQT